jgi:putative addiction module component (TIGR02574 family)
MNDSLAAWNKPRRTEIVMSTSLDDVTEQALKLTAEERAELIERLAETVVLPAPPLHPSWDAELARRVAEMDAGLVESIPAEQVFAEMRDMIDGKLTERRP